MRHEPEKFRLTFFLPPECSRRAGPPGRHRPQLAGCALELVPLADRSLMVNVGGPSREAVFEQARRFLRVTAKGMGPRQIDAVLKTPNRYLAPVDGSTAPRRIGRGGFDGVMILVDVEIGFTFTTMPCDIGAPDPSTSAVRDGSEKQASINHEPAAASRSDAAG